MAYFSICPKNTRECAVSIPNQGAERAELCAQVFFFILPTTCCAIPGFQTRQGQQSRRQQAERANHQGNRSHLQCSQTFSVLHVHRWPRRWNKFSLIGFFRACPRISRPQFSHRATNSASSPVLLVHLPFDTLKTAALGPKKNQGPGTAVTSGSSSLRASAAVKCKHKQQVFPQDLRCLCDHSLHTTNGSRNQTR